MFLIISIDYPIYRKLLLTTFISGVNSKIIHSLHHSFHFLIVKMFQFQPIFLTNVVFMVISTIVENFLSRRETVPDYQRYFFFIWVAFPSISAINFSCQDSYRDIFLTVIFFILIRINLCLHNH